MPIRKAEERSRIAASSLDIGIYLGEVVLLPEQNSLHATVTVVRKWTPASRLISMQDPGQRLRRTRENLGLTYRDVEEASHRIASNRGNHEYLVGLSRLADIENKGTVPSVYRMYSLCAIYKLRLENVLSWFGVEIDKLPVDAAQVGLAQTYSFDLSASDH